MFGTFLASILQNSTKQIEVQGADIDPDKSKTDNTALFFTLGFSILVVMLLVYFFAVKK